MEDQIPSLKKQNLKHAQYAKKSIQQLFSSQLLNSAQVKLFTFPSSVIAFNKGYGQFALQRLPTPVQLSSVNAACCMDLNGDGIPDLVLGGNEFGFLPQFGRLDASFGHVLIGKGHGQFQYTDYDTSGLQLPGQIRDITPLKTKDHVYLLFLRNDDYPALYRCDEASKSAEYP
jgi:hypothetical protein